MIIGQSGIRRGREPRHTHPMPRRQRIIVRLPGQPSEREREREGGRQRLRLGSRYSSAERSSGFPARNGTRGTRGRRRALIQRISLIARLAFDITREERRWGVGGCDACRGRRRVISERTSRNGHRDGCALIARRCKPQKKPRCFLREADRRRVCSGLFLRFAEAINIHEDPDNY
jgi:hypothetical protein